jgi:asparagine synthetase B (glutamine-hydrolysing)
MKEQASLRVTARKRGSEAASTRSTGLKTLVQTEGLLVEGAGMHHTWRGADGAQFALLGEVVGVRRPDGTLADPSMFKVEPQRFEDPARLSDLEGRYVFVKVAQDGTCDIWTDRQGRIDVYWQATEGGVVLGTGLDLLPVSSKGAPADSVALAHALTVYGNRPAKKHTFYKGVSRLGVDEGARLNGTTVERLERGFEPIATANYGDREREQYADILLEAVRARASRDGNVVSLSSGWDSTSILACLVHLFGKRKVRAVIGRMRYAERSGVINQFEIDRAQAVADYFGVPLDIHDLAYFRTGPELLEQARPMFQAQQFANMSGLSQWILAKHIAETANADEVVFNGEMSDGAHNLGFSQFVTIFHPASYDFREYSDKMASHLFGPTFLRELMEGKHEEDPVWQLFRHRAGNTQFDELATDPAMRTKQLLASFFLRGGRLPLHSLSNSKLLTSFGSSAYAAEMEGTYLAEAAQRVTPETLYSWYLHLYNSFHWQGATVVSRIHAALAHGLTSAMPFNDRRLIEFLSAMPESWGRGLDLKPTKYPLKWMLQNRIDYPFHLQVGPHSYLYDVDPSFSHMAEILFASSFAPVFKQALKAGKLQQWLDTQAFDHAYIDRVVRRYLSNEEFRGAEMNDLGVLAMQAAVGCYGL